VRFALPRIRRWSAGESVRFAILMIAAIDTSVLLWALDGVTKHPAFDLLVKAAPAIFGVTLAAYLQHLTSMVREVATRWWFALLTVVAFVVVVIPQAWGVRVALSMPVGTQLYLDNIAVIAEPLGADTLQAVNVRGLRTHRLEVEYYDGQGPRRDEFSLGPDLLLMSAFWGATRRAAVHPYEAYILSPVTVYVSKQTALIEIRGHFPPLFLAAARRTNYIGAADANGEVPIRFHTNDGHRLITRSLPAGSYHVRGFSGANHCWSPAAALRVDRFTPAFAKFDTLQCAQ
jgi:hypothetical protein